MFKMVNTECNMLPNKWTRVGSACPAWAIPESQNVHTSAVLTEQSGTGMTEIIPVPQNFILLFYDQRTFRVRLSVFSERPKPPADPTDQYKGKFPVNSSAISAGNGSSARQVFVGIP